MNKGLALFAYNLALPLALLVSLPGCVVKMLRRGNYGKDFLQRFGRYRPEVKRRLERGCGAWIHAVSVGEVFIARKLIEEIRRRGRSARIVLSTTTSTGYAEAKKLEASDLTAIYNPVDLPWVATRAFRAIAPRVLVLVEAEIWPNLVTRATRAGTPVLLVNARLSRKSEARFRRFRSFVAGVFGELDAVLVQYGDDVARWTALGVAKERVRLAGSIKYDLDAKAGHSEAESVEMFRRILDEVAPRRGHRSVLLLGSTHPGEEKLLAGIYLELRRRFPELFLVVAPRHFERATEVVEDLRSLGLDPVLRSTFDGKGKDAEDGRSALRSEGENANRCLVVDTTGELARWYELADQVVIGKSFLGEGGQNPVEPIVAGVPVFFGPRMSNFSQLVEQLTAGGGAVQAADADELRERLASSMENPAEGGAMVARAREILKGHSGATARTADEVLRRMKA